jgi:hypothetical protein
MDAYNYKPAVNLSEVATHLHGDDPKVVLLVQPYKEVLFWIMEDTTALWPVSVYTGCFIEPEWTKDTVSQKWRRAQTR